MDTTNVSEEGTTKKGYRVVAYRSISDESALNAYRPLAVAAVQSFGGRFLTGSASQIQAHEAGLPMRTTLAGRPFRSGDKFFQYFYPLCTTCWDDRRPFFPNRALF